MKRLVTVEEGMDAVIYREKHKVLPELLILDKESKYLSLYL